MFKDVHLPETFKTASFYVIVRHSNNSAQIVDDGNDLKENIPMFEDVQLSETFKTTSTYASEQYSDNSVQTVDTVKDHQGNFNIGAKCNFFCYDGFELEGM